jgi:hypothetical protein
MYLLAMIKNKLADAKRKRKANKAKGLRDIRKKQIKAKFYGFDGKYGRRYAKR